MSTGLAYVPGTFAPTDEVVALSAVARDFGGIYTSHMRDEGGGVIASVQETIRIGDEARIAVHISHHKVGGRRQFGQSVQTLALIQSARARGVDVTFDVYPYTASHTGLSLIFPRWAMADDGLNARLTDPKVRDEVKRGMLDFIDERFGDDPARIQLARCSFDPSLGGKTIADLLTAAGRPLTQSATADMVIDLQLKGGCSAIFHAYDEPDVERLMQSPFGMIGSDGSLTRLGDGAPHPRAFGTYPRVLGRYVRERHVLSLEDAVRKMTSFPAARLGLQDRGLVREGMAADLTIFDAAAIIDAGERVRINYTVLWALGEFLGESDGKRPNLQLIAQLSNDSTNDVMAHELGHTMGAVLKAVPPGLVASDHVWKYTGRGHQGPHCAFGAPAATFNDASKNLTGLGAVCKCIMYGANRKPASNSNGRFCEKCRPFLVAEALQDITK